MHLSYSFIYYLFLSLAKERLKCVFKKTIIFTFPNSIHDLDFPQWSVQAEAFSIGAGVSAGAPLRPQGRQDRKPESGALHRARTRRPNQSLGFA